MKLLIINTLPEDDLSTQQAIKVLIKNTTNYKIINTSNYNISHCLGCYTCMLRTPGKCCIKDDYILIFNSLISHDHIIFITDTILNFVTYQTKNIIDRAFPQVNVLTCFRDNEIRHIPHLPNKFNLGLLYKGNADHQILDNWFHRLTSQWNAKCMGVCSLSNAEALLNEYTNS